MAQANARGDIEITSAAVGAFVGCKAVKLVAQAVGGTTTVTFTSEEFDTDDFHDNATNTDRLVIPSNGLYRVYGQIIIEGGSTTGFRSATVSMYSSGGTFTISICPKHLSPIVSSVLYMTFQGDHRLEANQSIRMRARFSPTLDVQAGTWLAVVRIGD